MELEIGRGKKGRRGYGFDDIAIVPSRRTRDPDDIDITWTLGPYRFELPLLASAMDGVVSPETAVGSTGSAASACSTSRASGRATRTPAQLDRIAAAPPNEATQLMQEIYAEPVKPELVAQRVEEVKSQGAVACGLADAAARPRPLRGRARGRARHPRHPGHRDLGRARLGKASRSTSRSSSARSAVPCIVGGCASYSTGLHLMRTGAVGVLVGVGPGAACTTRGVLGSASPRRPRSPTSPRRAPSTCSRRASTAT